MSSRTVCRIYIPLPEPAPRYDISYTLVNAFSHDFITLHTLEEKHGNNGRDLEELMRLRQILFSSGYQPRFVIIYY